MKAQQLKDQGATLAERYKAQYTLNTRLRGKARIHGIEALNDITAHFYCVSYAHFKLTGSWLPRPKHC